MNRIFSTTLIALVPALASAAPRTSANYTLHPEGLVSGGKSSSTSYELDGAIDSSSGPVATSTNYTLKSGYVGQLYDVVSLNVTATSPSVSEGATNQMLAEAVLDDTSTLALDAGDLAWSVVSGPLSGVNGAGLAQTVPTFDDMTAVVEGSLGALDDTGSFLVTNINNDDTSPVAGDGIDDLWQFENFDENDDDILDGGEAPNADPNANPDGDPNLNIVEWLADFDPNDSSSFFSWHVTGRSGTTVSVTANKVVPGTIYRLQSSLDLENGPWPAVDTVTPGAEAFDQAFSDPNATEAERYYRMLLEKAP